MFGPGYGFGAAGATRRHRMSGGTPTPAPAATGTLTLTALPSHEEKRIHQRATTSGGGQGKGVGNIALAISGALAGTVNIRVLADDLTTVLQTLSDVTLTNGQTSLLVAGVDARLGWFHIELRDSSGAWQRTSYKCGMGALFGFAGQSLAVRFFGRQDGQPATYAATGGAPGTLVANDNSAVVISYSDGNAYHPTPATAPWQKPGDFGNGLGPNALGVGRFLNQMVALTGVNCGAFGRAQGAQGLFTFTTGQANWTILSSLITRIGSAFEGFYWGQGHSNSVAGCPANSYKTGLGIIFDQLTAANSFAGYGKYVWTIPAIASNQWGTPRQLNAVRKGAMDWCAANSATYVHMTDIAQVDAVHESQLGSLQMGDHMYRAARAHYGASSGLGPALVSASRVGTTITLTLSDVGQSTLSLVGTIANRIFALSQGRTNKQSGLNDNRFPISSVTVTNKTTLTIVLANDPGDGHVLDLWLYWPAGPTNATTDNIYDDRIDADGIAVGRIVQTNATPIVIAAPSPGGTVNAPPGGYVTQSSPYNMVGTSEAYGASTASGFGQEMTGGTAQVPIGRTARFYPVTVEGFFVCPTITASVQALFGDFGNNLYLAVTAAAKIAGGGGFGSNGTTTLVAGHLYHFASQHGPGGRAFYLTDITAGTAGIRELFSATPAVMAPDVGRMGLRTWLGSFNVTGGGAVDEIAVFDSERYADLAAYNAHRPTAPLTGAEASLYALWHLDNDLTEAIAA